MKINKQLNLVLETGEFFAHSTPISRECFEANALLLAKTFDAIYSEGISISGSRIAMIFLKEIAKNSGYDANGILTECKRLTNIVCFDGVKWGAVSVDEAMKNGVLDDDSYSEIMNSVVFFICVSAVLRGARGKDQLDSILNMMISLWSAQTTSSNCTEYADLLPTLTVPVDLAAAIS